jgi:hypothetical protein
MGTVKPRDHSAGISLSRFLTHNGRDDSQLFLACLRVLALSLLNPIEFGGYRVITGPKIVNLAHKWLSEADARHVVLETRRDTKRVV